MCFILSVIIHKVRHTLLTSYCNKDVGNVWDVGIMYGRYCRKVTVVGAGKQVDLLLRQTKNGVLFRSLTL